MAHSGAPQHVTLRSISHTYDLDPVLADIDLDIAAGSTMALLGPSGCGKTTLLRIIAGLEQPTAGSVAIGDRTVVDRSCWVPPEHRQVGMVFQDWALFPHLTVAANVGYGLPRADRKSARVQEALELVGLADLADRFPETLSGGQQQRVALARALAPRPGVLLLDEPFSSLDATLRHSVRTELRRLLHDLGTTSIFVTHDQEEAFVLGDTVALMRDGRLAQVGTPHELYETPADRRVAEFVGAGTILRCMISQGRADTPFGPVPVAHGDGAADVLLRPEQLRISPGTTAHVDLVEYYGHDTRYLVTKGDLRLEVRAGPASNGLRRGDQVDVDFIGHHAVTFSPAD